MSLLPTIKRKQNESLFPSLFSGDLFTQLDSFFDQAFQGFAQEFSETSLLDRNKKYGYPKVDVIENDNNTTLELTVPGLTKEDVTVEYRDGYLTVSAKTQNKTEKEEKNRVYREIHRSSFSRTFNISEDNYKISEIDGKVENGMLTLVIPKNEQVKTNKTETTKIELK